MKIDFNLAELETLLESLNYTKLWVSGATETPASFRADKLAKVEAVDAKIRVARDAIFQPGS